MMRRAREEAARLRSATRAANTRRSYARAWLAFQEWCKSAGRPFLPSSDETLCLWLADTMQQCKVSTAAAYAAAVAHYHQAAGLASPLSPRVRELLSGARRLKRQRPERKAALSVEDLRRICQRLLVLERQDNAPVPVRDRALLLLGFATGLRRSNLVALDVADVEFRGKGLVVHVASSKTDQNGTGRDVGIFRGSRPATDPVGAVRAWLRLRGRRQGALFCRVESGRGAGRVLPGERLSDASVARIVKSCVAAVGLDPSDYAGHSLRAGCATAAWDAGARDTDIMQRTGHKSLEVMREYLRARDPFAGGDPLARAL